jgi:SHS2 domain-containing protein
VNPNERPRYSVEVQGGVATLAVDAPDWPSLLSTAVLAVSDLIVPIGRFETWTARRVSARGAGPDETLYRVLESALVDWTEGGFLPSLVEVERAELVRVAGILRGGCLDPDGPRPAIDPTGIVPGSAVVTEGGPGGPWRARFRLRLA